MMRRREFITVLSGAAAAWPLAANAQQSGGMRRVGVLSPLAADDPEGQISFAAFLSGLQQLGWSESRNVRIDIRWSGGNPDDTGQHQRGEPSPAGRRQPQNPLHHRQLWSPPANQRIRRLKPTDTRRGFCGAPIISSGLV